MLYNQTSGTCKFAEAINKYLGAPLPTPKVVDPKTPIANFAKTVKFPELEAGKFVPKLTGVVIETATIREVTTRSGPSLIANFKFGDGETTVRVGLWGDLTKEAEKLREGDQVTLTNMSVKPVYEGFIQLSSTRNTAIE